MAKIFLCQSLLGLAALLVALPVCAQDKLKSMPGYAQQERMVQARTNISKLGEVSVHWAEDSRTLTFRMEGKAYQYDLATDVLAPSGKDQVTPKKTTNSASHWPKPENPIRARQFTSAISPDGKHRAVYRDRNVYLSSTDATNEVAVTTEGSEATRIKFGNASWVYGEELDQNTAMWWSSNSQQLAFYRFDESKVPEYYLALEQTKIQSKLDHEPYPKAGGTNAVVDLFVYDLASRKLTQVDVRSGKPFQDTTVGHYVYGVSWRPDSRELLFHRTNRRQNVMELCAANPTNGQVRVVLREEWQPSWVENHGVFRFLADGQRFIWSSERTGWKNFYLYDLQGRLLARITDHLFEVADIVSVDEASRTLYYMARSGDNPLKLQLHRVDLDGRNDFRLTDPTLHHRVYLAPDHRHFVDVAQRHDLPPALYLANSSGERIRTLGVSELTQFKKLRFRTVELLRYMAADGRTPLYGLLHFPPGFKPSKKYPLLVSVYAGPATGGARETFVKPDDLTDYGFLVASFDSRTANGRGKRQLDSCYQNFGTFEIADQAAGVRSLYSRRYVDRRRVGIFGTSYGGTASALCLLKYPEVFKAACSCSPVGDFRNYDSIYTERYLWLPQQSPYGYDQSSLVLNAPKLAGDLLIYFGTADDNVHPANSLQFIEALQRAGKSFEVQVGPDLGHTAMNRERMMEFFIQHLASRH